MSASKYRNTSDIKATVVDMYCTCTLRHTDNIQVIDDSLVHFLMKLTKTHYTSYVPKRVAEALLLMETGDCRRHTDASLSSSRRSFPDRRAPVRG